MCSYAAQANELISEIETLHTYSEFGNGDVVFTTKVKDAICYGYWLNPNYGGSNKVYSALLSAFQTNTKVALTVSNGVSDQWPGSTNQYCKLIRVGLSK